MQPSVEDLTIKTGVESIPLDKYRAITKVHLQFDKSRKPRDSKLSGGSIVAGLRVLKEGEYARKREWHVPYKDDHRIWIGSTEELESGWQSVSFSGKVYSGSRRDDVLEALVSEFLQWVISKQS